MHPSENTALDDVESAFVYLTEKMEKKIPAERVVIMGRSLGTGPSCYLASKLSSKDNKNRRPAGLILQSPFLSAIRVVFNTPFTLPIDIFPNLSNSPNSIFLYTDPLPR